MSRLQRRMMTPRSRRLVGNKVLPATRRGIPAFVLRPLLEGLEDRVCLSVFYDFDIMARTGQDGIGASLQPSVSINDSGNVAFVAASGSNQNVFVSTGPGSVTGIALALPNRTYGSEVQINNSNQVAVVAISSGATITRDARIYSLAAPGSFTDVGSASSPLTSSSDFDSIGAFTSMTNDGKLAFAGLEADEPLPPSASSWEVHIANGAKIVDSRDSRNTPNSEVATLPAAPTFFRFMAADGGHVVIGSRDGAANTPGVPKRVVLYDNILGTVTSQTIATTAGGLWSDLGVRPGISDDGRIVTFYGDLTATGATSLTRSNGTTVPVPLTPGKGIFASVELGGNRYIIRIAGQKASGEIDPGERRLQSGAEAGPDFNFDGNSDWGIESFDPDSRPSVEVDPSGDFATVAYVATDESDGVSGPGEAVFVSRLNLFSAAIGVEAYVRVARVNQALGGFGNATDLAVHDSINEAGQVVFWASNGTTRAVIRANPKATTDHPYYFVNGMDRPMPDSPIVQYVVPPVAQFSRTMPIGFPAATINQILMHATVGTVGSTVSKLKSRPTVSIHYVVSREGAVIQLVPEDKWARHADNVQAAPTSGINTPGIPSQPIERQLTNLHSIGIELVDNGGHLTDPTWFTEEQARSTALLVRDVTKRNNIPQEQLLPFPYGTTRDQERKKTETFLVPNVSPTGPPVSTDPMGYNILQFGQRDATADYKSGTPVSSSSFVADGFDYTARGIITHGQVVDRTLGKTDAHPRYFDGGWQNFMTRVIKAFGGAIYSPANLFIIDPLGRRLGVDPSTGFIVNEIPGAFFSGIGSDPQSFSIPDPLDGDYVVRVVGTGSGNFRLVLFSADAAGAAYSTEVSGVTSLGQTNNYTFANSTLGVENAKVTSAVNLAPVTKPDVIFAAESVPVVIDTISNDNDPDGTIDPTQVSILVPSDNGLLNVDPVTGKITYTPQPGFVGDDQFIYAVKDNLGASSLGATVSITVEPNTTPPQAVDDSAVTAIGTPVPIQVLDNDSDPDGSVDPATLEIVAPSAFGTLSVNLLTGTITYTPNPGFVGTDEFQYVVRDNLGVLVPSEATVTITVQGAMNQPPVLNPIGSWSPNELATLSFTATATDPDLPANTLTFSLIGAPTGAGINASSGLFTWTPTEAQGPGAFTFKVRVTDDGSPTMFDEEEITVTVNEVNTAPVLSPIGNRTVDEQTLLSFTIGATDADLPANTLVYSASGLPSGATFDPATRTFSWTPTEAQDGAHDVTFTVNDGSVSASEIVRITVFEVNQAPVLSPIGNKSVDEQTALSFTIGATDADLPANTLVYSASGLPSGATFDPATRTFSWTPTEAQGPGPYLVTFRVSDGSLAASETITVTVNEVNAAPVLAPIGNKSVAEGALLSFNASASDADLPANGLTFSLVAGVGPGGTPVPAGASINPATGAFTWTPTPAQGPGSYIFKVKVTDNGLPALSDEEQITITVVENVTVDRLVINDGDPQRSMVTSQTILFSGLVDIDTGAFELKKLSGGTVGLNIAVSDVAGKTQVVLTYLGSDIIGDSLADGFYSLVVHGDLIHDRVTGADLDGDGDGTAGGDRVDAFFRMFGDADGDADVDNLDYFRMRAAAGRRVGDAGYRAYLDFNGDGIIDIATDVAQFNLRRGRRLIP